MIETEARMFVPEKIERVSAFWRPFRLGLSDPDNKKGERELGGLPSIALESNDVSEWGTRKISCISMARECVTSS